MILPGEVHLGLKKQFEIFGKAFNTIAEAEHFRDETIARREKIAGRVLSDSELKWGIRSGRQPGWETPGQRIAAENWRPTETPVEPQPIELEPNTEPLHNPYGFTGGRPMPAKARAALSQQQYEDRLAREGGLAAPVDPTRAAAKDYARNVWEKVAFSPHSTAAQIAKADQLLKQADHDLATFSKMADSFRAQTVIAHAERTVAMEQQISQITSRNSALEPLPSFEAPTAPADEAATNQQETNDT